MKITVFGPGCAKCKEAEANAIAAGKETGLEVEVEKVSDLKQMMSNGIMSTPAVMVDGTVKCVGRVPQISEFIGWIKGENGGDAQESSGMSRSCCSCGGKC